MKNLAISAVCGVLLSGCAFIMQDGEHIRYYGIREDDGAVLSRQIARLQGQEPQPQDQIDQTGLAVEPQQDVPVKIK